MESIVESNPIAVIEPRVQAPLASPLDSVATATRTRSPIPRPSTKTTIPQHLLDASPSWESVSTFFLGKVSAGTNTSTSTQKLVQEILQEPQMDLPDAKYTMHLLLALMLTTTLACFSALDAKNQCINLDGYDVAMYDQLYDDGWYAYNSNTFWERLQEKHNCLQMFRWVMIPVTVCTLSFGVVALVHIRLHYVETDQTDVLEVYRGHLHQCVRLFFIALPILVGWSYGIIAIMLSPRDSTDGENPYRSLAAVDHMGHIGQNANLYYLSWFSVGLSIAVVYQIGVDTLRQLRRYRAERHVGAVNVGDVEAMLSSLTTIQLETFRESRATWYQSLYRLRIRTGIWTAALLTALVVMTSSAHIWRAVLIPTAESTYAGTVRFRDVCGALQGASEIPPELCVRTAFSLFSGLVAALLCMSAILMHVSARNGAAQVVDKQMSMRSNNSKFGGTHIPLKSELILAVILSNLLGLNAVFATGVQGPAATVGNLYYASWIGFLLCLRICLGCLEEMANLEHEEDTLNGKGFGHYVSADEEEKSRQSETSRASGIVPENSTDLLENDRAQRTRMYMSLTICSTACSASALDAAINQSHTIVMTQSFVIYAPSVVAMICACQFLLCLRARSYIVLSQLWLGGVLSIVTFCLCMASLVLTMHSESSWAVNKIGDIEIANLYYFTWASIIIAALQMASYSNTYFGKKQKDYVTVVWVAICKVCFVLLGSGYHVWHTISETCTVDDVRLHTVTFCSKTIFAIAVAVISMCIAGLVALTRILITMFWPTFSINVRAHVEMLVSFLLVLLFGMAVVLITGIGGPGQSVGDMYYSTWLCFFVTIGLAVACLDQIRHVRDNDAVEPSKQVEVTEMKSMYTPPEGIHLPSSRSGRPPISPISRDHGIHMIGRPPMAPAHEDNNFGSVHNRQMT